MGGREQQAALERARQGDAHALGSLLESYRPYVGFLCRAVQQGRLRAWLDEADLIQEAFLEVHRSFGGFRGTTVAQLTGWLRQIVLRTTGRVCNRRRVDTPDAVTRDEAFAEALEADGTPSDEVIRHEQAARLAGGLAQLPEDMRQVLLSRHMDQLPYADVAERLGRSEGAVRVLYVRALQRLRELCKD